MNAARSAAADLARAAERRRYMTNLVRATRPELDKIVWREFGDPREALAAAASVLPETEAAPGAVERLLASVRAEHARLAQERAAVLNYLRECEQGKARSVRRATSTAFLGRR